MKNVFFYQIVSISFPAPLYFIKTKKGPSDLKQFVGALIATLPRSIIIRLQFPRKILVQKIKGPLQWPAHKIVNHSAAIFSFVALKIFFLFRFRFTYHCRLGSGKIYWRLFKSFRRWELFCWLLRIGLSFFYKCWNSISLNSNGDQVSQILWINYYHKIENSRWNIKGRDGW